MCSKETKIPCLGDTVALIVKDTTNKFACAVEKGIMTPEDFNAYMESISLYASGTYDAETGNYTQSITNEKPLSVVLTKTKATTPMADDGTASVVVTGGSAPYTIAWSQAGSSVNPAELSQGSYTLSVTDSAQGSYLTTFIITSL